MIEFRPSRFTADEKSIGQFEFVNRLTLPADYRDFLLKTNGGTVEGYWIFDIPEDGGATSVAVFFPIVDGRRSTSSLAFYQHLCGWRLPKNVIVIASDGGGGKICLGAGGAELGKVYYWDPDKEHEDIRPGSFENFLEVAPTFTAFMASLRRDD